LFGSFLAERYADLSLFGVGADSVLVVVELGVSVQKFPYILVTGVKNVTAIFMHSHTIIILLVKAIACYMITTFEYLYIVSLLFE
jgi:hypothetical protein